LRQRWCSSAGHSRPPLPALQSSPRLLDALSLNTCQPCLHLAPPSIATVAAVSIGESPGPLFPLALPPLARLVGAVFVIGVVALSWPQEVVLLLLPPGHLLPLYLRPLLLLLALRLPYLLYRRRLLISLCLPWRLPLSLWLVLISSPATTSL
jgi:hypothetical protein